MSKSIWTCAAHFEEANATLTLGSLRAEGATFCWSGTGPTRTGGLHPQQICVESDFLGLTEPMPEL